MRPGDAAGCVNPFNGEGIAYGYETGRLAATFLGQALSGGGADAITAYAHRLDEFYGTYYRVGRAFVRLVSDPRRMRLCVSSGMHSRAFMAMLRRMVDINNSHSRAPLRIHGELRGAESARKSP